MPRGSRFPPGFLWGASTASHQVEGNNRFNDWWEYEEAGKLPHRSGAACEQYQRYEQDFDLAASWGHNAHRLSLEWSRFEPDEGRWDSEAVAHYRRVLAALRARGIEPLLTLHHFSNPAWFARRGGWLRRDSADLFARFVDHVARMLDQPVRYWLTINEPTVYVLQGFGTGEWPPCRQGHWLEAARALRNLARAHVRAYQVLHARHPGAQVGFAHSAPVIEPCAHESPGDRAVAWIRDYILNEAFFRLIGATRPGGRRPLDFLGINYYTRNIVRRSGAGLGALVGHLCTADHHVRGPMSTMGWEVYPQGLVSTLERFSRLGLPLMITENGVATEDETLRGAFLLQHIDAAAEALSRGVNLIGYCYWSLIDNYEWAFGTTAKFGLAAVDFSSQARRARPCADSYARICRENRLP
jgi:beta-glucosidase